MRQALSLKKIAPRDQLGTAMTGRIDDVSLALTSTSIMPSATNDEIVIAE
jgi:hypothetical protein